MPPDGPTEKPDAARATPMIIVCSLVGITALRATDGAMMWAHLTPLIRSMIWPSIVSSGEVIYLGTAVQERGSLHLPARVTALSVRDGAALWQTDLKDIQGPPALAVDSDRVFAVGDGSDRALFALDAQTGAVRWIKPNLRGWSYQLIAGWNALVRWAALSEYLDLLQDRGTYRLLAAHHEVVYLDANGHSSLHALEARTGRERWRSPLRGSSVEVIAGEKLVVTTTHTKSGLLIAVLRAADGTVEHTLPLQQERERPLLLSEEGVVYLMRGPELCAVRVSDGRPVWCTAQVWEEGNSPYDGALRACLSDQTLFYSMVQSVPKKLTVGALDRQTGKKLWEWRSDEDLSFASNAVNLVGGHGQLYVATHQGLFAFRERDGQLLWRALPATDLSFVQPALAASEHGG